MTTVGIATMTRNSADVLPGLFEPFRPHVDKIAVLLGGLSTDGTAKVAQKVADVVGEYEGPLDENGRIMDFGAARQQSFDLLDTDWIIVVDTDDVWSGQEHTRTIIETAIANGVDRVMIPHRLGDTGELKETRLYRRNSGKWTYPVHNNWEPACPEKPVLTIDAMRITKNKPEGSGKGNLQSVILGQKYLADNGPDLRIMAHLIKDLMNIKRYEEALDVTSGYIAHYKKENAHNPDQLFFVFYHRGLCAIYLDKPELAYRSSSAALTVANYGHGWALLAEAAYRLATNGTIDNTAMLTMALFAADEALRLGRSRLTYPVSLRATSSAPWYIKGRCLLALGRKQEALASLEMHKNLQPQDEEVNQLYLMLCKELGILP